MRVRYLSLNSGLFLESHLTAMACLTEDAKKVIEAFFEKKKPVFKGR